MSFGFGVGDFITIAQVSKLAWDTFTAIKNAPKEWRALESEVQSLAISLKSLDDADTTLSIVHYTKGNPQREQNLKDLLTNSNNALAPMAALIEKYRVKDVDGKREIRDWLAGARFTFNAMSVQEFRNKLALHTASLNIFLTTLTNTSLGRLEQLIISGQSAAQHGVNLVAAGTNPNDIDDGFEGVWSAIGRDISLGTADREVMTRGIAAFRDDIRNYVQFLVSGGLPYSRHELSDRQRLRPQKMPYSLPPEALLLPRNRMGTAVTYSLEVPIEEISVEEGDSELKALVDAMVSFDGDSRAQGDLEEDYSSGLGDLRAVEPDNVYYMTTPDATRPKVHRKKSHESIMSTPLSETTAKSGIHCDGCHRELLVGDMYLHCSICHSSNKDKGYDVCDICWEKGRSCPGKHRDKKYFNHRERRIAEAPKRLR